MSGGVARFEMRLLRRSVATNQGRDYGYQYQLAHHGDRGADPNQRSVARQKAMSPALQFVAQHGPPLLFAAVFVEQLGIPLPATPWVLAAGALAATGKINMSEAIAATAAGSLVADVIWFSLGRSFGRTILNFLCRISLKPGSCVERTENVFVRHGLRGLLIAKFIPGLSTIAPVLAGSTGVGFSKFLIFDSMAALLYAGIFNYLGFLFSNELEEFLEILANLGASAFALVVGAFGFYIGAKLFRRRRLIRELNMARVNVEELHTLMLAEEKPVIPEVRSA
jgi:membrane protein DedA with SNARE-associated domain